MATVNTLSGDHLFIEKHPDGATDIYTVVDGERVAKRIDGAPHAGKWIPIISGYEVLEDGSGKISVFYNGKGVA
jgi:hypothetical protein